MDEEIDLRFYFQVVKKRKWLIIATFVVITTAGLIISYLSPRTYEATTTVKINQSIYTSLYPTIDSASAYINSGAPLRKVLSQKDLDIPFKKIKVQVNRLPATYFIEIRVTCGNASKATIIANSLADLLVKESAANLAVNIEVTTDLLKTIRTSLQNNARKIDEVKKKQGEIEDSINALDTQSSLNSVAYALTLSSLKEQLNNLKSERRDLEAQNVNFRINLADKTKELEEFRISEPKIIAKAIRPSSPASPKIKLNVMISATLAILVGLGLAFFLEFLKRQ